jgi:hypothetical protein
MRFYENRYELEQSILLLIQEFEKENKIARITGIEVGRIDFDSIIPARDQGSKAVSVYVDFELIK